MDLTHVPIGLAVIVGSTREGRFAPVVAQWFAEVANSGGDVAVDLIDLANIRLPEVMTKQPGREALELSRRLSAADAFVVVTPEYNHSFPAPLKNAIDSNYLEWRAKPVGFVSYGGLGGGLRAVEQLRLVFAELHAVTVRDTVSFHGAHSQFDGDGQPKEPEVAGKAARRMLRQIVWWARALRDAKSAQPYDAAA